MKKQNLRTAIAAATAMLVLILDGRTALSGASEGISVCINTLIPSLFPFILLSILLAGSLSGQEIPFLRPAAKLCHLPKGAESLIAIGFLGGYPVGAQNVALLYRSGQVSNLQASRMITICNNAGPAFIFGVLGCMFSSPTIPWLLWAIHIASALFVGAVLPGGENSTAVSPLPRRIRMTDALSQSVRTMGLICGWVILMRMAVSFLQRWFLWMMPLPLQVVITGILELANGCIQLESISCEGLRFLLASAFLSLGGGCVMLQTASVTEGIPMSLYFPGKLLQCTVSILLACGAQYLFPAPQRFSCGIIFSISAIISAGSLLNLRKFKNNSRILEMIGV